MNTDARFEAIKQIYPETGSVQDGLYAFDPNGKPIEIDESKIKPVYEKKLSEYNLKKYQFQRLDEYPSIRDCVHALLDGGDTLTKLQAKRAEVKAKYPKPT